MNSFYYYILFTLILEISLILLISYKNKGKILPMYGMTISMCLAMNIGLTAGVLFGSIYQGDIFISTIVSMFIGMIVGLLCGMGLGLLPSIEGTMAGLMGGMMGAMLGAMIQVSQISIILIILLTFSLSSMLLFLILPGKDNQADRIYKMSWLLKPFTILVVVSAYLLYGFNLSKEVYIKNKKTKDNAGNQNVMTINIETKGNKYKPSSFIIRKNLQVSLILKNMDNTEHDIEIEDIAIKNLSGNAGHQHSNAAFHLHVPPTSQNIIEFIPLETGIYQYYCTIPGHKEAGMTGVMKVVN
jgi:uncharacterized cupredoxin-like copper-binding protein